MKSPQSSSPSRLELERRVGGRLVGWHACPAPEAVGQAELLVAGVRWPLTLQRIARDDVVSALALEDDAPGFELTLPWQVWREAVPHGQSIALRLQGVDVEPEHLRRVMGSPAWPAEAPVGTVERLFRLGVQGWYIPEEGRTAEFAVLVRGYTLRCPSRIVERMDVAAAWWLPHAQLGFQVEIPGSVWQHVPQGDAELQLLVNGQPLGSPLVLMRAELAELLAVQMRPADPKEDLAHSLLVFEHLVMSGEFTRLPEHLRQHLLIQATEAGLPVDASGLLPHDESQVLAVSNGVTAPKARVGRWLRHRWVAAATLWLLVVLKRSPRYRAQARQLEIRLTLGTGLFDKALYLRQLGSREALQGHSPLAHYVDVGDARSLVPNLLLDPRAYTGQLPGRKHPGINRLLHHALYGRFHGLAPSAWFDVGHYLRSNEDVRRSGTDPLSHFLRFGWQEQRTPVPGFSLANEGVHPVLQRLARLSANGWGQPVLNHLLRGLPPGAPVPTHGRLPWMPATQLDGRDHLDPQPWLGLPRQDPRQAQVCIIVPVYAGAQETLRCLWAVLTAPCRTPFELLVVDDCSPEPALSAMLLTLAEAGLLRLLVNERNLGFVQTVNRALAQARGRDVVILNADACVANDWLDRLMAHAAAVPRAASITPLSNNATLCSYPHVQADNWQALELTAAEVDRLAASTLPGWRVEAPTGVGFCMFMRQACLADIGLLDAERFGRGYGEENDWCMRALAAGWVNLIVADIFVQHQGAVSFASESSERILAAMDILAERFPDYQSRVAAFAKADPLLPARVALDTARLLRADSRPRVLMISHARGGGTARYELEEMERLAAQGLTVLRMRPSALADCVALVPDDEGPEAPNLLDLPLAQEPLLLQTLRALNVVAIQLHHLVDLPESLPAALRRWCEALSVPLSVVLHDYHAICPRINLVGPDRRYCGEPEPAACMRCLAQDAVGRAAGDISRWRETRLQLLSQARDVLVPDDDVKQRLQRYFPSLRFSVQPHQALAMPAQQLAPVPGAPLKVMVVGALGVIKGYEVVLRLARSEAWRKTGGQIRLLGYSMDDEGLMDAGVQVLGRYSDMTLVGRLREEAPDWVWLPSIWPETYCYVLSAALEAGCRVAVFDIGAQARRLRELAVPSLILPLALSEQPQALSVALAGGRQGQS